MELRLSIVAVGLGMMATALPFPKPATFSGVAVLYMIGIGTVILGVGTSVGFWVEHDLHHKT